MTTNLPIKTPYSDPVVKKTKSVKFKDFKGIDKHKQFFIDHQLPLAQQRLYELLSDPDLEPKTLIPLLKMVFDRTIPVEFDIQTPIMVNVGSVKNLQLMVKKELEQKLDGK